MLYFILVFIIFLAEEVVNVFDDNDFVPIIEHQGTE